MIPHRLKIPKEAIPGVMKTGRSFHAEHLFLRLQKEETLKVSHFSVIVSKKTDKRAVGRNRLKRLIYEVISANLKNLKPGFNVLLLSKPGLSVVSPTIIMSEVSSLLKQAGLVVN